MPDFSSYLVPAFTGFASGFLVSIPVGPINISIVNEGARRGFGWAFLIGLGATLTTLYLQFEKEAEAALGLPPDVHSYALLPIGYPLGRFGPVRRVPLSDVVFGLLEPPPRLGARLARLQRSELLRVNGQAFVSSHAAKPSAWNAFFNE